VRITSSAALVIDRVVVWTAAMAAIAMLAAALTGCEHRSTAPHARRVRHAV